MDSLQTRENESLNLEETLEFKFRSALKENPIMTDEGFINDMVLLSTEFYSRFSGVKLDEYLERLKTLKLEYFGKYAYPEYAVKYLPSTNVLAVNKEKITKQDIDCKHALMKAIIAIASTKGNNYGFGSFGDLEALNEGFIDLTARSLVGDEGKSGFNQEREIVDFIGKRIGVNPFTNAFFTNKPQILLNAMNDKCQNLEKLQAVLGQINHNMHTKKEDSYLIHVDIERELISMFGKVNQEVMKQTLSYTEGNTKTR